MLCFCVFNFLWNIFVSQHLFPSGVDYIIINIIGKVNIMMANDHEFYVII